MAKRDFGQNTWTVPVATSSTNLGPLTTPVALPSDCYRNLYNFQTPGLIPSHLYTYYTQGCAISSCCPPKLTPYTDSYQWLSTYYSPGVCPLSYRQCAGPSNLQSGNGETVSFCCPSSYLCPADPPINTNAPWWACQSVLESTTNAFVMDNLVDQNTITTRVLTSTGTYNVAYPIQIRWKEGDNRITEPATGSVSTTSSASSVIVTTSAPIGAPTPTSSTPSNSISTGGGLSAGAAAGIGIGATLGVLAAGLIIYFIIRSCRQKKHGAPDIPAGEVGGTERNPAELSQDWSLGKSTGMVSAVIQPEIAEMDQGLSLEEYGELDRRRRAAELSGRPALPAELLSSPRAELEARRAYAGIFHELANGVEG